MAAGNSVVLTCAFQGNTKLTPSLAPFGGSGTYSLNDASLIYCSGEGAWIWAPGDRFSSSGTYTSSACGSETLTGTFDLGSTNHDISGNITMQAVAGGLGPVSVTGVSNVNQGGVNYAASGTGDGAVSLTPSATSPGPSDCADSLVTNGQLALSFSY